VIAWVLFIGGAVIAVTAGMLTLSPNGGSLLGVMLMLWGFGMIAVRDVRNGL